MLYQILLLHWVNRLSFLSRKDLAARLAKAGLAITPEEWAILLFLQGNDPTMVTELAEIMSKDSTTMTRLVDGMARKNLVERHTDPKDRRRSLIALSSEGNVMFETVLPLALSMHDLAQKGLAEADIQTTLRTLSAMVENLKNQE